MINIEQLHFNYDENEDIRIVTNGYGEYIGNYKQSEKEKHTSNKISGWHMQLKKEASKNAISGLFGGYFHYVYVKIPKYLDKKFKVYMLKMCTTLNYKDKYIYSGDKSDPNRFIIKKDKDMMLLLGIKDKKTYASIRNTLKDNNILFKNNTGYYISPDIAIKGDIDFNCGGYTRVFTKGFNELYSNEKDKSNIGYLAELIPYLNIKYNIICHNPDEKTLENIMPMTMSDIARCLGVEQKNSGRLKNKLLSLKLEKGEPIGYFGKGNSILWIINPNIYYSGNNDGIDFLRKIFEIDIPEDKEDV